MKIMMRPMQRPRAETRGRELWLGGVDQFGGFCWVSVFFSVVSVVFLVPSGVSVVLVVVVFCLLSSLASQPTIRSGRSDQSEGGSPHPLWTRKDCVGERANGSEADTAALRASSVLWFLRQYLTPA